MSDIRARLRAARQSLVEQLAPDPEALSIDGKSFTFRAPVDFNVPVGGYVVIDRGDGIHFLGLLTDKHVVERAGPQVKMAGDAGLVGGRGGGGAITETVFNVAMNVTEGSGRVLARLREGKVESAGPEDTFEAATMSGATPETVSAYLRHLSGGRAPLDIGSVRHGDASSRAYLQAVGFDRHTFLCGQSGSGKTYALGVVLERLLLETDLRIVVLDPNSDFVNLGSARSFEDAARGFKGQLENAEAYEAHRKRFEAAAEKVQVLRPVKRGERSDSALRTRFSDLQPAVQGMVLQLDPLHDLEEFDAFLSIRDRLAGKPYSLADVRRAAAGDLSAQSRNLALRISNLRVDSWDIWAEADEDPFLAVGDLDWSCLVLDIGGLSNPAEQSLISLGILNYLWHTRNERRPLLLVIDEAHTVCPAEPTSRLQEAATERAVQIAGEGRKFGIYVLVSTQRPQKLHPNVISQCDNLLLMRMNSDADIARLADAFSFVPPALLQASSGFSQGESLVAGKVVPSPIMVKFGGRFSQEGGSDVPTDWAAKQ